MRFIAQKMPKKSLGKMFKKIIQKKSYYDQIFTHSARFSRRNLSSF